MRSSLTLSVHCDDTFMGSWNGINSGRIRKRDMRISHGMSRDHGMGWAVGHNASVEEQVDIPWNVPWGTVGWDGQ